MLKAFSRDIRSIRAQEYSRTFGGSLARRTFSPSKWSLLIWPDRRRPSMGRSRSSFVDHRASEARLRGYGGPRRGSKKRQDHVIFFWSGAADGTHGRMNVFLI